MGVICEDLGALIIQKVFTQFKRVFMSEMLKKLTVVANGKFSKLDICSDAAEYASGRFGAVIFVQHLYDEAINKVFKICR